MFRGSKSSTVLLGLLECLGETRALLDYELFENISEQQELHWVMRLGLLLETEDLFYLFVVYFTMLFQ
jgi:hypothetical protein